MPPSSADLVTLSRLLDEALDLAPAQLEAWLSAVPAEHVHLLPNLREMLARRGSTDHAAFLSDGPTLEAVAPEDAVPGQRVGPYRLIREIGHGGMGTVWLAERVDGALKRQVALKLPRLAWGAGLAERMARERDIGALLEHPNIARLYDAGLDTAGRPYLALEYIEGEPVDIWCDARALPVRERLRLMVQVVKAVSYAHGRLVVHRDLKPSNVLVTADGQTHLLDFGIAKLLHDAAPGASQLTQEQGRVLTPHYASPEQIRGDPITVQSDVYSLGVLMYQVLTGTLPVEPRRSSLGAVEDAVLVGDVPLASRRAKTKVSARALRGEVDAILRRAMHPEPSRRYATADALAQDVERHLAGETVSARPDSVAYRMRKAVRRHWIGVSATAAVLLAVVSGSGVAVMQAQRAAHSAERERVVKEFVADVFRINSRPDPGNLALRPKTPQGLIEGGARLIETRFTGQPELQAELYGVVGGVFSDMGAYRVAADYAIRRIEVLDLLHADRVAQAQATLALAEALVQDRQWAEAELRAQHALELAKGHRDLEAAALVMLARAQIPHGRLAEATASVEAAERIAAAAPSEVPAVTRAWIIARRGRLLVAQNRGDEASVMYEKAIDMVTASDGPLSRTAIRFHLDQAFHLSQMGRPVADALRHQDAAISALQTLGGAHELRAALEAARFAWHRDDDGISAVERLRILEESRALLATTQMPVPEWYVPQIDFWIGSVKGSRGDLAAAVPLLESSGRVLWVALANPLDRFDVAAALGKVMMDAGQHDSAAHWFAERMAIRRQLGEAKHPWAASDFVLMAHNLVMSGRYDEAQAVIDGAPHFPLYKGAGSTTIDFDVALALTGAEIRLARGDAQAAVALVDQLGERAHKLSSFAQGILALAYGPALCETGRKTQGQELLTRRLADYERDGDLTPSAPWPAQLRALLGLCVLGTGDRARALALAAQARAAFAEQPGVSPYYKAASVELDKRLGIFARR